MKGDMGDSGDFSKTCKQWLTKGGRRGKDRKQDEKIKRRKQVRTEQEIGGRGRKTE